MNEAKIELSREKIEQIKTFYANTERLTKVAKEFNITPKQARKILVDNGVKVRKIGKKITCPNCGSVFSNSNESIRFCSHCGTKMKSETEIAIDVLDELCSNSSAAVREAWDYIKTLLEE